MYSFNFMLTKADYEEFNMLLFTYRSYRILIRVFRIIMLVLIGFLLLGAIFSPEGVRTGNVVFLVIVGLGITIGFKPFALLIIRLTIAMLKKQGKLPYGIETQMRFDCDSYTTITDTTESMIKYSTVERIVEGRRAVYLYIGSIQASIIPLSAFESYAQKDEFVAFIGGKISRQNPVSLSY